VTIKVPSVPLTYVIGTVGLLVILGIVTLIATTEGVALQGETTQNSLFDAAQYVSNEITGLVSSIPSGQTGTIYYKLVLPQELNLRGYAINLSYISGQWQVLAYVPNNPSLSAKMPLPFQPNNVIQGSSICVYLANGNPNKCSSPSASVNPLPQIYSGDAKAVVWAYISGQSITIGIGDMN
jgi:hypothetical protein